MKRRSGMSLDRVGSGTEPRALPRALDVAAAFGSQEAYKLLKELAGQAPARLAWTGLFTAE